MQPSFFEECVEAVLNTRDFCGDESAAIKQVAADYGVDLSGDQWDSILLVLEEADRRWAAFRRQAKRATRG